MLIREAFNDYILVDGKDRPTTNSKGHPIHNTEEGIINFWKWFGNSKIVDSQGRPKILYHATTSDFNEFNPSGVGAFGRGIYLSENPDRLKQYWQRHATGGNIMPVYVKALNPSSLKQMDKEKPPSDNESKIKAIMFQQRLIKAGHDSSIDMLGDKVWEMVVFEPTQIKSATGNSGKFGINTDSIVESELTRLKHLSGLI